MVDIIKGISSMVCEIYGYFWMTINSTSRDHLALRYEDLASSFLLVCWAEANEAPQPKQASDSTVIFVQDVSWHTVALELTLFI